MRSFYSNHAFFLSLCCFLLFSLSSIKAQSNEMSVIPTPQRKNTFIMKQTAQPKRIIEMQETDKSKRFIPIPKRNVNKKLEDIVKPKEVKNEIKSEESVESKKNELAITEIINSIRDKLTKCWSIPENIDYKENFSIKINLLLSSQGEIVIADVADSNSYKNNPLFRSIADSAMRAAYKCSPITGLPIEYYHIWREVILDFILNE